MRMTIQEASEIIWIHYILKKFMENPVGADTPERRAQVTALYNKYEELYKLAVQYFADELTKL